MVIVPVLTISANPELLEDEELLELPRLPAELLPVVEPAEADPVEPLEPEPVEPLEPEPVEPLEPAPEPLPALMTSPGVVV